MNMILAAAIDRQIAVVCDHFPPDDRPAVRAFLLRAVTLRRWQWVGARLGTSPRDAFRLGNRGRRLLEIARRRRRIERESLSLALAAPSDN